METVIDFIKEFQLSTYGLDIWDMLIAFGILVGGVILLNWLISFLSILTATRLKRVLSFVVHSILYGIAIFTMLNSFLTKDYVKLATVIFVLIVPYLRQWVGKIYEKYDGLTDKIIRRK